MALERAGVELVAENAGGFVGEMDRARDATGRFVREAEGGGPRLNAFSEIATGALRRVGEVAVNAFMEGGRALAGFLQSTITTAGDYEGTLNRFSAVTGDAISEAGMEIEQFNELFLEMGAVTQYSAGEAAQAAVELAKGGLDPATIAAGGLEGAMALAAAGELELAAAAEIAAKQLGVWGDEGVTAAQVADRFAQAANASTVDVDDLALGMANVGGVARIAGASFDETTTALALLAPGFSGAADAGTSLKTFMMSLLPTTANATDAMRELGLITENVGAAQQWLRDQGVEPLSDDWNTLVDQMRRVHAAQADLTFGTMEELESFQKLALEVGATQSAFYDAEGSFIGFEAAAELLQSRMEGLTDAQQQAALKAIFGQDAFRAAAGLAEAGAEGYNAMVASMEGAGSAMDQAAARNQGLNFAMDEMKGSIETLQIRIGQKLIPTITDFIENAVTPAINFIGDLATAFFESENPAMALANTITTRFPEMGPIFAKMFVFVMRAREAWEEWGPVVQRVVGAVMTVIGNLATRAGELVQTFIANWPQISATIQTVMGVVRTVIDQAMAVIGPAIASMVETVRANADSFRAIWQNLTTIFRAVGAIIGGVVLGIVGVVVGLFGGIAMALGPAIQTIEDVTARVGEILNGVKEFFTGLIEFVLALFRGDWSGMGAAADRMAEGVLTILNNLVDGVVELFLNLFTVIGGFIGGFIQSAIQFFQSLYNELVGHSIIPDMVNGIIQWIASLRDRAIEFFTQMVLRIVTKAVELKNSVMEKIETLWTLARVAFALARDKLVELVVDLVLKVLVKFTEMKDELLEKIKTMWDTIRQRFSDAVQLLRDAAGNIGRGIIEGIIEAIRSGASGLVDALVGAVRGAIGAAMDFLLIGSPSRLAARELGAPMAEGIEVGINARAAEVVEALRRVSAMAMAVDVALPKLDSRVTPVASASQQRGAIYNQQKYGNQYHLHQQVSPCVAGDARRSFEIMQVLAG